MHKRILKCILLIILKLCAPKKPTPLPTCISDRCFRNIVKVFSMRLMKFEKRMKFQHSGHIYKINIQPALKGTNGVSTMHVNTYRMWNIIMQCSKMPI